MSDPLPPERRRCSAILLHPELGEVRCERPVHASAVIHTAGPLVWTDPIAVPLESPSVPVSALHALIAQWRVEIAEMRAKGYPFTTFVRDFERWADAVEALIPK